MTFTRGAIATQLAAAATDRLRVLIIGAGIAGATAAALLRAQGLHPVVIERAGPGADPGYMLALMPLVDPAIAALGLRNRYLAAGVGLDRYRIADRHGRLIREYSLAGMLGRHGDYRGLSRGALLDLLGDGPACYGTTVTELRQDPGRVTVALRTGAGRATVDAEFDVVIAADGLHSATRDLLLPAERVQRFDSGWGGWVSWAPPDADLDLGEELWGTGFFAGTYPVAGRIGVFVGGPREDTRRGPRAFTAAIRDRIPRLSDRLGAALHSVATNPSTYYWPLVDRRATRWASGRVVLLGDAAAGFLPTAGIGAGMAIESANLLCAHLRSGPAARIPAILRGYERAQAPRVLAAQDNSRALARLMLHRSRVLAAVRDTAARRVSLEIALRPITKLLRSRPSVPDPLSGS